MGYTYVIHIVQLLLYSKDTKSNHNHLKQSLDTPTSNQWQNKVEDNIQAACCRLYFQQNFLALVSHFCITLRLKKEICQMFLFQRKADRQCQITNLDDLGMKTIAQWIYLRLPPCRPRFESQAHQGCFYQNIFELCRVGETKINKKRSGFFKKTSKQNMFI